jgi:hypothetical protein
LPVETRELLGFTHKAIITFADMTAAATTTLNLFPTVANTTMPVGRVVTKTGYQLVTPFTGGGLTAVALDVGDVGTVNRYIANANTDLFTGLATNTKNNVVSTTSYAYAGADAAANAQITAKFTGTNGNLNLLTAGQVEVYLRIEDWNGLTRPQ